MKPPVISPLCCGLFIAAGCAPDAGLTKYNAKPTAAILSPADGEQYTVGSPLTLRGAAGDPDDDAGDLLGGTPTIDRGPDRGPRTVEHPDGAIGRLVQDDVPVDLAEHHLGVRCGNRRGRHGR